jgi:lipoprotein-releasing system ATP-binding protein
MSNTVLSLENVSKSFKQGKNKIKVLQNAFLDIKEGEVVALVGPSGSGKSTLLQIAGLLDSPTTGKISINGDDCTKASDSKRTMTRTTDIGFIYQFHHLLPEFTAIENVVIPQLIAKKTQKEAQDTANEILKKLGLASRLNHKPAELSGGEQQRVAIARAIVNNPSLLLADEPTGNLDPETSKDVFDILIDSAKSAGLAMLIVTHNLDLAKQMDKIVTLSGGEVTKYKNN